MKVALNTIKPYQTKPRIFETTKEIAAVVTIK
jgi:hypothetical protein